jgi:hypothetical protein
LVERLSDIEALSLQCQSEQSKAYIAESIRCYRAGAYRAAIVSTWIAIVFDLIDKIRELSLSGDGSAKELEQKYEKYINQVDEGNPEVIKNALDFERNILESCHEKLSFFDSQQLIDLKRLREDRNRCAHPSFQQVGVPYEPSAEQARLHIRNAIIHVLKSPPVQGKAALAELKTIVSSRYFPTETEKAVQQLRSSSFQSANEALVRSFIDQLVFGFLTKGDPLFYKKRVVSALNAASEMYPDQAEKRLKKQINKVIGTVPDEYFIGAVALVAKTTFGWIVLGDAEKEQIIKFIQEGQKEEVLTALPTLSNIADLKDAIQQRIDGLGATVIQSPELRMFAKEKALAFVESASNWAEANKIFDQAILPIFDELTVEDISRIIKMPTEHDTDLLGASGYRLFIEKVRKSKLINNHDLNTLLKENRADYLVSDAEVSEVEI